MCVFRHHFPPFRSFKRFLSINVLLHLYLSRTDFSSTRFWGSGIDWARTFCVWRALVDCVKFALKRNCRKRVEMCSQLHDEWGCVRLFFCESVLDSLRSYFLIRSFSTFYEMRGLFVRKVKKIQKSVISLISGFFLKEVWNRISIWAAIAYALEYANLTALESLRSEIANADWPLKRVKRPRYF